MLLDTEVAQLLFSLFWCSEQIKPFHFSPLNSSALSPHPATAPVLTPAYDAAWLWAEEGFRSERAIGGMEWERDLRSKSGLV